MRTIALLVLSVFIASAVAQYRATSIFSASGCNDADLVGVVSELNVSSRND